MSARIVAWGAISPLGEGESAASAGTPGEPAKSALARDEALASAGLERPSCGRIGLGLDAETSIVRALEPVLASLDRTRPGWRSSRVGLAIGTSSGGMAQAEKLFRGEKVGDSAMYFSPSRAVIDRLGLRFEPCTLVLSACAASTVAIGLGTRWLERGACDLVIAGGFDAVTVFVAAGFEALRATTASSPKPFALGRDGMALGEGAGFLALASDGEAIAHVAGFGASGDAVHLTAPDREGAGLARAAERALASAGMSGDAIDLVSVHGTSTPYNDAAESKTLRRVLGSRALDVPAHPFKAQIGHTLGAAGVLESLVLVDALKRGIAPASIVHERDPDAPALLLPLAETRPIHSALKLSAAFGGANAALVLSKSAGSSLPSRRSVYVGRAVHVDAIPKTEALAAELGLQPEKLGRACELTHLALAAVAKLPKVDRNAGVVVGHAYATLDVNDAYFARILEKGARHAEPHRFPYTTPAAVGGEVSVAFKLAGPNIAVGSGLHGAVEAVCVAADLVAAGDADAMVVVAVDAPGRAARAVAEQTGWPLPPLGAVALVVGADPSVGRALRSWSCSSQVAAKHSPAGHAALLSLAGSDPSEIVISSPQGSARLSFS